MDNSEKGKLAVFANIVLSKEQVEAILGRKISNNEYKQSVATSEFEKDFFKLMNNSIYGKTMENVRLRIDLKLVKNFEQAKRYIRKPNFDYLKRFDENLCAVHM